MPRVAFIYPQGVIEKKNHVRHWAHGQVQAELDVAYNAGDLFVTEASLRLLDADEIEGLQSESLDQHGIDRLNAEFDYAILRGANCITPEPYVARLTEIIRGLRIPVIPFGIGMQCPTMATQTVTSEMEAIARALSERCSTIGVRGEFTASMLERIGIKNVDVIGCPTIFRHNRPSIAIRRVSPEAAKRIGFTLTRGISPLYSPDPATARLVQRRLLNELLVTRDVTIMSQAEVEEKAFALRDPEAIRDAHQVLIDDAWLTAGGILENAYLNGQVFFSGRPLDYEILVKNLDFVLGTRLHGNAMALANGTPAVFLPIDSRVQELASFWRAPILSMEEGQSLTPDQIIADADFRPFEAQYREAYVRTIEFLDRNGVRHKMRAQTIPGGSF